MGCSICGEKVLAKGWCSKHYKRWRRGADLEGPDREPIILPKTHPVYVAWVNMKSRCNNQKSSQWKWYGKRGIKVCADWDKFKNFYKDMFNSWESGLELDRKDVDGDYSKENCRWITHKENCSNRRERTGNLITSSRRT